MNQPSKKEKTVIGWECIEDCTLNSKNYHLGQKIKIAEEGEDYDWPGIVFFEAHPTIFAPIYKNGKVGIPPDDSEAAAIFKLGHGVKVLQPIKINQIIKYCKL